MSEDINNSAEASVPSDVMEELKRQAASTNKIPGVIEKGGKLRDGTLVAGVPGTTANRKAHELGVDIRQKKA